MTLIEHLQRTGRRFRPAVAILAVAASGLSVAPASASGRAASTHVTISSASRAARPTVGVSASGLCQGNSMLKAVASNWLTGVDQVTCLLPADVTMQQFLIDDTSGLIILSPATSCSFFSLSLVCFNIQQWQNLTTGHCYHTENDFFYNIVVLSGSGSSTSNEVCI